MSCTDRTDTSLQTPLYGGADFFICASNEDLRGGIELAHQQLKINTSTAGPGLAPAAIPALRVPTRRLPGMRPASKPGMRSANKYALCRCGSMRPWANCCLGASFPRLVRD
jgi:hypothetical protein